MYESHAPLLSGGLDAADGKICAVFTIGPPLAKSTSWNFSTAPVTVAKSGVQTSTCSVSTPRRLALIGLASQPMPA